MSDSNNRLSSALAASSASALLLIAGLASGAVQAHGPAGAGAAAQARGSMAASSHIPDPALDHASDRANSVAPPLGGTHPDPAQDGKKKGAEKAAGKASDKAVDHAADRAKTVAPPLGGDPANAKPKS